MAEIYTPDEIALKLKISEQTVRRYLRQDKIKGFKLGNNWRVKEKDLLEFIDGQIASK